MSEDIADELYFLTMDCARADAGLEESPTRPAVAPRREVRRAPSGPSPFLSIAELTARWGCGRTFVYEAVAEMEQAGYLKRIWLGRVQRLSIESVERWEGLHATAALDTDRATIASLRTESTISPRAAAPSRRRSRPASPAVHSTSIVDAWRQLSKRAAG
jgi:hypothetical protein